MPWLMPSERQQASRGGCSSAIIGMLFLARPARERDCPPRTGDEEPRHPRTMGPSPLPVMLAEPTGPGAAGKVPGRMDSHGGHRTGSVPSGAAGATKPLPSGLYRIARIAPKRAGGGVKALTKTGWAPSAQASGPPVWTLRASGGGRSNSCIISVSRGTCSRRRKVSRTSFARTIVSARSGGNWRGSSAGGEIDQAESARFRQDENRSESRNSGLRVEKRGLKRPGGPAFQDSGPPAWTFCCGSDRYCSGSHSQKPCIPTAFAGQGSWVTSASSHRCRPLLNPDRKHRVIGGQDLQCGRCDAAKGSYSRLASLRVRPPSPSCNASVNAATRGRAVLERPEAAPLPPPTRPPAMDQHRRVGHRVHRAQAPWIAQAPGPTPWPGPPGPRAQSPTPPAVSSGRGSRTGEGVPPSVNYKLEMRRPLSNRRETTGKTAGRPLAKLSAKPPQGKLRRKTAGTAGKTAAENRRGTTGKNCRKTAGNRREKPRFWVTFASLNKGREWPERVSPTSFFGPWGGLP